MFSDLCILHDSCFHNVSLQYVVDIYAHLRLGRTKGVAGDKAAILGALSGDPGEEQNYLTCP